MKDSRCRRGGRQATEKKRQGKGNTETGIHTISLLRSLKSVLILRQAEEIFKVAELHANHLWACCWQHRLHTSRTAYHLLRYFLASLYCQQHQDTESHVCTMSQLLMNSEGGTLKTSSHYLLFAIPRFTKIRYPALGNQKWKTSVFALRVLVLKDHYQAGQNWPETRK